MDTLIILLENHLFLGIMLGGAIAVLIHEFFDRKEKGDERKK